VKTDSKHARERAEASFKKKEIQFVEGQRAWAEYETNVAALREKTARLRALRLARESAGESRVEKVPPSARCVRGEPAPKDAKGATGR
jgi:hypothetical protein